MPKAPAFQFYVKDWLSDSQLVMASKASKGIWVDCLCYMWGAPIRGKLTGTPDQLARLLSCSHTEIELFLNEIHDLGFADIENDASVTFPLLVTECHKKITLCNRRMYREYIDKENNRLRQERHRNKQKGNKKITPPSPSPSPSPSSITTKESAPPPTLPQYDDSSNHWVNRVGPFFKSIKQDREAIISHGGKDPIKLDQLIGWLFSKWGQMENPKKVAHPKAVSLLLTSIRKRVEAGLPIENLYGYASKVMSVENGNCNEGEAISFHIDMKKWNPTEIKHLTFGIMEQL